MNFLLSANKNYLIPLSVCITSILENHKNNVVTVYIFENDFDEESKEVIKKIFYTYNQFVQIIHVDNHYYNNAPLLRWTKETYYRLLLGELIKDDLERILYLDCDIIVNKNIRDLYNIDLKNNCIAALPEINNFREKIGLKPNGQYFQAGVILFDVKKYKETLTYNSSIQIINELGRNMIAVDQDIINIVFDAKILPLEERYNNCNITSFYGNNLHRLFNYVNKQKLKDTYIFHYASGKPWNNTFSGACEGIWNKYLLLSPFKDHYYKFNTVKYKFLRLGLIKYFFFLYTTITPLIEKVTKKLLPESSYSKLKEFYRKKIK